MKLGRDTKMLDGNMIQIRKKILVGKNNKNYMKRYKDATWRRWHREHVKKSKTVNINVGDVVMIKGGSKKRGKWKTDRIRELFQGKDDQIQGARLKAQRDYLDPTAVSFGVILEQETKTITRTRQYESDKKKLNVEAKQFRPKKTAAAITSAKIKDIAELDDLDND